KLSLSRNSLLSKNEFTRPSASRSKQNFVNVPIADIVNARLIRLALAGFLRCLLKVWLPAM
ncbi:MAG: hypothetical protein V7683_15695, partial [Pseudoalteromonas distincta]